MLILLIKTDQPQAELSLYEDDKLVEVKVWQAHRILAETISLEIEALLKRNNYLLKDLGGIGVFKGPGSFTGLRIGISVANALAYGLKVGIVGAVGNNWQQDALDRLTKGQSEEIVIPEYGQAPHTTKPRK